MPADSSIATSDSECVYRTVRWRLLPQSQRVAQQLAGTAGACRFVWNHFLALKQQAYRDYRCWQDYKIGPEKPKPNLSFFTLSQQFTALRHHPHYAWLQEYGYLEVRYSLKYLADAYREFRKGQRACPRFKRKHGTQDGFTITSKMKVRDNHLYIPRIGWLRLKGSNLYAAGTPLQARIKQEGTRSRPRWYAYIAYAVPAASVKQGAPAGVLGLDRNVGQVTDSTGHVYRLTDQTKLAAKIRRKQRYQARKRKGSLRYRRIGGQLTRLWRKQKRIRANDTHHISRALADKAHTLVVEELHIQRMTQSARGTRGAARHQGQGQGRPEPQHQGQQLGPAGAASGLQVRAPGQGEPPVHEPDLPPVRNRRPTESAVASPFSLCAVRICAQCGSQCRT